MRYLFLTILILTSHYCQSQKLSDSIVATFSIGSRMSEMMAKPIFRDNHIFSDTNRITRLDFGVKMYLDGFSDIGRKDHMAWEPYYFIRAYTIDDVIFMREVEQEISVDSISTAFEYTRLLSVVNKRRTKWYVRRHNKRYHSSWRVRDFTENRSEFGVYGFDCGGPFSNISKEGYAFAKLVKESDMNKLKDLASSFYSSDRAVGTAGLYFLQLRGIKLSPILLDLVSINRNSEIMVTHCMSDVFGIDKMNKVLDDEHLKWIYDTFVEQHMF